MGCEENNSLSGPLREGSHPLTFDLFHFKSYTCFTEMKIWLNNSQPGLINLPLGKGPVGSTEKTVSYTETRNKVMDIM